MAQIGQQKSESKLNQSGDQKLNKSIDQKLNKSGNASLKASMVVEVSPEEIAMKEKSDKLDAEYEAAAKLV